MTLKDVSVVDVVRSCAVVVTSKTVVECDTEYDYICHLDASASRESLLQSSIDIYQLAADWSPKVKQANCDLWTSVVRRRGNALNELGVFFLNQAAAALSQSGRIQYII